MRLGTKSGVLVSARLLAVALVVFCGASAWAQVLYGTLTGVVEDKSGAVVPGVAVVLTSAGTGESRTVNADDHGSYLFVNVLPGQYSISIAGTANFAGYRQNGIAIQVNREARVDVDLAPPTVNQEVVVNTTAPILQTETAEVNHEISQVQISELPITSSQGRNFQALYTLIPGFSAVGEQNSTAANPSRAESANVNGTEDMGVTTRIDGAMNTYGWLPYLVAYVPPADSIQSVNVVTNSFNAEQGMAGGAAVNVTIKGGQRDFHGSVWEYNQLYNVNARGYTNTAAAQPQVPKNIFNQFGGSIGGPVYIPHLLTGKKKLFFFDAFERTTRRQLITGLQTVPTSAMLNGDFSSLVDVSGIPLLYDPQPGGVVQTGANTTSGYLNAGYRPTFLSEYGCNCIPAARIASQASKMLTLLQPVATAVGTPTTAQLAAQLANDYFAVGTYAYNRNTNDAKVTYVPTDATTLFGRYSMEPFSILDPQSLGTAGGAAIDGGQPGAASGRIQNVGIGLSHVVTQRLVIDADAGYTRQVTGAKSLLDASVGDFGLNTLGIPGTNGVGSFYEGMPGFAFTNFTSIGNPQGANPYQFRDNQFTADVNVSWTLGKHSTKYGFGYYHFLLNHFQPTSGGGISIPRGGFQFQGGMTTGGGTITGYNALADFLLGLPNNGTGAAIAHPYQISTPNSLRWSNYSVYAQDQWTVSPKLTLNYGARYEYYPAPYRDHTGVYRLDPTLGQSGNVVIGGVNGNPENAGFDMPKTNITPRAGIAYRVNDRTVIRAGGGLGTDPDSLRFLRDSFPIDQAPTFSGLAANSIAVNPANGQALTLAVGIPNPTLPNLSTGFVSLPVSGSTNTAPANYRRGYIESWNLAVQQDLGHQFIMNIGYVGDHQVRQLASYTLNAAPLPSSGTLCMANGQYNPSTGLSGSCNFAINELVNINAGCNAASTSQNNGTTVNSGFLCYNSGGITMNAPIFSANYNGLQTQLTRAAGRLAQFGLVYTWSHAFDYVDNGAGSGSSGTPFSYPGYFKMNRATATYDRTNNLQFWTIYHVPFGAGQQFSGNRVMNAILGGFQVNGQISHISGTPFSVSPANSTGFNSPGNTLYADLVAPYKQLGGHNRIPGNNAVSGGKAWFDPTSFATPVQPTYSATQSQASIVSPHFGNTHRNQFRGPGQTIVNASVFRGFHVWRESEFQVRAEAFNLLNHAILNTPNTTITPAGGVFGYITSFGATRTLQFSGRFNF